MKQAANFLLRAWVVISLLLLVAEIISANSKEDAVQVAFVMFILGFPSSVVAGELLNLLSQALDAVKSPRLFISLVWIPFFLLGYGQWLLLLKVANQFATQTPLPKVL